MKERRGEEEEKSRTNDPGLSLGSLLFLLLEKGGHFNWTRTGNLGAPEGHALHGPKWVSLIQPQYPTHSLSRSLHLLSATSPTDLS